jgi:multidrug efflux pump subunit AcrA (membrane-fusion protein)
MRYFSALIRYATFVIAAAGLYMMYQVIQQVHATETAVIPPPPVTPPEKPYTQGIAGTGILEARAENVLIGVPVPGLVEKVFVKVSDTVKEGQPLMKIDDRELSAQLLTQQASVEVSKATVELKQAMLAKVQDMLDRMNAVEDKRAISMDDLRNRKNDVLVATADAAAAKAQLLAAESNVKSTQLLLERLTIMAPRAGQILQVNIRAGEYASTQPKSAPIVLGDLSELQVRTDIDEQNAVKIREGQAATAYIKGDTRRESKIPLVFERVEPFVIPKVSLTGSSTERVDTRVLQVIYRLKIPEGRKLYVGQQVDVFIETKE